MLPGTRRARVRTRNRRLDAHTQLADRIFREGLSLLEKELDGTKFRLLGIGVSDLGDGGVADPPDLIDQDAGRRAKAEAAGSGDFSPLWSGQSASLGVEMPARQLVRKLAEEAQGLLR